MSNIIEEIKLYVKHGKLPIVQDSRHDFSVYDFRRNEPCRITELFKNKKDIKLGAFVCFSEIEYLNNMACKIVGQYDIPTIPFEVGQKVKVREDIEPLNIDDWNIIKTHVIGKIFTVEEVKKSDTLFYVLKGLRIDISHDWLLPILEEECSCRKLVNNQLIIVNNDGCCVKCGAQMSIKTIRTVNDVLAGLSDEDKEIIRGRLR